jgi:uncharacterized protein (TIGR02646 family)
MRPVDKGAAPRAYTDYGQARHDLAERIGYYCSYCEMKVYNSIEVEHILPQNQGGAVLDWSNFLLSCKYCNTIKSDHNANTTDYFWPDIDNTDLAFTYSEANVIQPTALSTQALIDKATATINLMGLDRFKGGVNTPTFADTRWRSREEIWTLAKLSYNNWIIAPIPVMANQIGQTSLSGHYSIWCKVFENVPEVTIEIDNAYFLKHLFKQYQAGTNVRVIRATGQI